MKNQSLLVIWTDSHSDLSGFGLVEQSDWEDIQSSMKTLLGQRGLWSYWGTAENLEFQSYDEWNNDFKITELNTTERDALRIVALKARWEAHPNDERIALTYGIFPIPDFEEESCYDDDYKDRDDPPTDTRVWERLHKY